MSTLQRQLANIRELQSEELDFVGGAGEASITLSPSYRTLTINDSNGHNYTVTVIIDEIPSDVIYL